MIRRRRKLYKAGVLGGGPSSITDDFARADGAIGGNWLNANWYIASEQAYIQPTDTDRTTNGDFESWASANDVNNWIESAGDSVIAQESTNVHGGTYSVSITRGTGSASINQPIGVATAGFARLSTWVRGASGGESYRLNAVADTVFAATTSFVQSFDTRWHTGGTYYPQIILNTNSSTIYVDDAELILVPLSEALNLISASSANGNVGAAATIPKRRTGAGVAMCWDSQASPANGLIAWHTGDNEIYLDKVVSGTRTELIATTVSYSAGAVIEIRKDGGDVSLWYGGSQIGTTQDISAETSIINNKLHGMFSVYEGNRLDNFFHSLA